ncbi:siphovirus Gp157 family protein [Listeria aquatica]|uniref:Siphovirus Gp157 family protein n=1 Tax=Listeria aquatica TaxID=1494960 RepID=A0A841ZPH6_9LIST|nr:siphovirus Gp157 family protein [Listeria aquatica]MBC1521427.1 siphovirus Gp157 family protein [Listeria aquatica]
MKLYDLTEQYNQVLEIAEQVDAETLKDTLDSINEAIEDKAESTAKVVRTIEAEANAIDEEIKRLNARKQTLTNNAKGLKEYLQTELEKVNVTKVSGKLFTIRIQNNPQSVNVEDETKLQAYLVEQQPKLDKKALLNDLKAGKEVEGAQIKQTKSLRIV